MAHADTCRDREYRYDPGPTHKTKIEDGNIIAVKWRIRNWALMTERVCAMAPVTQRISGQSCSVTNGEEHGQTGSSWSIDDENDIARRDQPKPPVRHSTIEIHNRRI